MDAVRNIIDFLWRKLVFLVGDIRSLGSFPYLTWAVRKHEVGFDEIIESFSVFKPGDIGLHRDNGYLSNVAIPGFFKHAWVHVNGGQIVEAISDGVVRRNAIYPLYSDFSIILRPKVEKSADAKTAVLKAMSIVGEDYDVDFEFDIDKEISFFSDKTVGTANYDPAFSCTEVASFSWWHCRKELGLKKQERRGRQVIIADDFMSDNFEIVWMSESVTAKSATELGLHPEGIRMIDRFLLNSPKKS